MILSQLVRPWFAAASMSGSSGFTGNLVLVPDILSSTHQGKLWYITSAALVLLLVAAFGARRINRPVLRWPFVVSLLLIACTKAASGHAANEGDFSLAESFMLLHVLGIAIWAGAIVASGFLVLPHLAQFSDPAALWSYGKLLSKTVTWALAAILISGIYTSDRELNGALSGLWQSGWGRILMTKIAFVLLALALGACTRFRCVQRPATSRTIALMVRLMRAEAVVMILILSLSGVLANTPPAMTEALGSAVETQPAQICLGQLRVPRGIRSGGGLKIGASSSLASHAAAYRAHVPSSRRERWSPSSRRRSGPPCRWCSGDAR